MAYVGAGGAGGLVDETVWGDQYGVSTLMGCWVYGLGQAAYPAYSGLWGWSNPAPGNSTFEGILLVGDGNGPIIRQSSNNIAGSCELDSPDFHTSGLSAAQLGRMHIAVGCSPGRRQMWFDGVLVNTDTRPQTGPQYFTTLGIGYGLRPPVSLALCQMLSGYPAQSDVTRMASGMDVRDIARASSSRLSPVRQFVRQNDLLEDTGLFKGFLLNSDGVYQRKLEIDVPPSPSYSPVFDGNIAPMTPWSGLGGVPAPTDALRS